MRLRPDYPEAIFNLANILAGDEKFTDAVKFFREAIRLRPDYVNAHNNLGNALAALGNLAEAVGCYESAIRLTRSMHRPTSAWARRSRV